MSEESQEAFLPEPMREDSGFAQPSPAGSTAHAHSPREWITCLILFFATLISTTLAGFYYAGVGGSFGSIILAALLHPSLLLIGMPFSATFIGILLAHELGHYLACKRYGIHCTLPFFIPLPLSMVGTLGAFIRIKSPFPNRKALFDVGIAGPLGGFAVVLPALVWGISRSHLIPKGGLAGGINFGEPILFRMISRLVLGYSPDRQDMMADPIAMAAWFGMLATCLNLFPVWQLDGGHIAYSLLSHTAQRRLSIVSVAALIAISFAGWPVPSYLVFGLLLLFFGLRFRFHHPPTLADWEEVDEVRAGLAAVALMILIVSFTPVPISFP